MPIFCKHVDCKKRDDDCHDENWTTGSGCFEPIKKPKTTNCDPSNSTVLLCLKLRDAIADKEWCIAAANREIAQYGEWRSDWYGAMCDADKKIHEIFKDVEA